MKNITVVFFYTFLLISCRCKHNCEFIGTIESDFKNINESNSLNFKNQNGNIFSFQKTDSSFTKPYKTSGKGQFIGKCALEPECNLINSFSYTSNASVNLKNKLQYSISKNIKSIPGAESISFNIELFDFKRSIPLMNTELKLNSFDSLLVNNTLNGNFYDSIYLFKNEYPQIKTRFNDVILTKSCKIIAFKDSIDGAIYSIQ